jgi:hypothetical protein
MIYDKEGISITGSYIKIKSYLLFSNEVIPSSPLLSVRFYIGGYRSSTGNGKASGILAPEGWFGHCVL